MALTESTMLELGTTAPDFSLPDVVSGKTTSLNDLRGKQALLVLFICTHSPYVTHVEGRCGYLTDDGDGGRWAADRDTPE